MKKVFRKLLSVLFVGVMALSLVGGFKTTAKAAGEEYDLFIAIGANNDWSACYAGEDLVDAAAEIPATIANITNAKISEGGTATVSVEFAAPVDYTWYVAPTLVAEGVTDADFTVQCLIDGNDVTDSIDFAADKNWWYEQTGSFADGQTLRIAGGYNEWGAKYIAESPANFTKIEYVITANKLSFDAAPVGAEVAAEGEFDAFVAIGANNDWSACYAGEDLVDAAAEIPATIANITNSKISVGGTTTVGIEFAAPVDYTWYVAPVVVAEGVTNADFTVKCLIDGNDVTDSIDFAADKNWWYEQTGSFADGQTLRLAGGYNEWGAKYMAESPANYSKIEFVITANSIMVGGEAPAEEPAADVAVPALDKNGKYNAYIGFQTPVYSFRNGWNDSYGLNYTDDTGMDYFHQVTGWDGSDAITKPGELHDAVIEGNGTYTVSATGLDFGDAEFETQDYMNLIFLSTDIPNSGEITISDMSLSVDGRNVSINPVMNPDDPSYMTMFIQNIWNDDVKEIGYYGVPMSEISITFTVSGFDYDKPVEEAPVAAEPETVDVAAAPADAPAAAAEAPAQGGVNVVLIVVIAVVVVAAVAVAVVLISKKKKAD